jgi:hypothetical protein
MPLQQKSSELARSLLAQAETGMGYQYLTVNLRNGRSWHRVLCVNGSLTSDRNWIPPFAEADIAELVVTHDKSGEPYESTQELK